MVVYILKSIKRNIEYCNATAEEESILWAFSVF